jgi:predicted peptidase
LLVWLHGYRHQDERDVPLNWLSLVFRAANGSPPLFIFAPENEPQQSWFTVGGGQNEPLAFVSQSLDDLLTKYPIDRDRIYLIGISAGGSACWELVSRRPEMFAAIAPMASAGGGVSVATRLTNVPIWAFHARDDALVSIDADRAIVAAIKSAGGIAELTETEPQPGVSSSHNCWTAAFQQYKLLDWLLAQRRGVPVSSPPGESAEVKLASSLKKGFDSIIYIGLSALVWMTIGYAIWWAWNVKRSGRTI